MEDSIQINTEILERSESSDSDISRREEKWSNTNEKFFDKIKDNLEILSVRHNKKGRKLKKIYNIINIPLIILPVCLSVFGDYTKDYKIIYNVCLIIISILNGFLAFFDFGGKCEKHMHYDNVFSQLKEDIVYELALGRKFRRSFDCFLTSLKIKIGSAKKNAPIL